MMCSKTASCYSRRSLWLLISRKFSSNNVLQTRLLSCGSPKTCFQSDYRKACTENIHHQSRYFTTGKCLMLGKKLDETLPEMDDNQTFTTIYKHPYVPSFALISKVKSVVYVFALADIGYGLTTFQSPDANVTLYITGLILSMLAAINLTVFSQYASNFVGIIQVNEADKRVKVSHLNFRGNRKDLFMNTKDIVPLSETSYTDDNKVPFLTKDGTVKLRMSFSKGHVLDHDRFYKLLC